MIHVREICVFYLTESIICLCPQCNIQVHSLDVFKAHRYEQIEVMVRHLNFYYSNTVKPVSSSLALSIFFLLSSDIFTSINPLTPKSV